MTNTLEKGDKIRLKVGLGIVDASLSWWGVRFIAN